MEGRNDKDSFISQLLEETYESVASESGEEGPNDLYSYFQKKSLQSVYSNPVEYFEKNHITYFYLQFIAPISCYRLQLAGFNIDIPRNWSFAGLVHEIVENGETGYLPLWENEYSHFCETIEAFLSPHSDMRQAVVVSDKQAYLVVMPQGDEKLANYLESFSMDHKSHADFKIAA